MKNKILVMLMALVASVSIAYPAIAYDVNTPASYTVNYVIQSSTTFEVKTASATLDFAGNRNAKEIFPTTRNLTDDTWGNVSNGGNVPQTFKASVDGSPTGVILRLSNVSVMTTPIIVGATPMAWRGSSNVPANATVDMVFQANFTNAVDGTYIQKLNISV